jgi:IclR family pca regulon transcriptional regulator
LTDPDRPPKRTDFVQSLERGLAVMRAFDEQNPELTLSDVARRTGLTRAAARRFLLTLVELGYVRSEGRIFALRPRVLELGYAYLSGLGLEDVATPHMERLVSLTRESSSITVLDGDDIVYVVRVPTRRIMTVTIAVGTRFPAYATSMGRVLLAALPQSALDAYLARVDLQPLTGHTVTDIDVLRRLLAEAATQGYAIVDQELEDGLRSVAAPISDASGAVVASINASMHASRTTLDVLRATILPQLLTAASGITTDLRGPGVVAGRLPAGPTHRAPLRGATDPRLG